MQIRNYNLIRSLERNTLSELFLARHVHEDYYVKIRVFDQQYIANVEVREAILERLRNSFQMRHRNIIATLDYGVEGRYMYQVQEHMDLGTLEDLLEKVPCLPPEISVFVLQEVLRGLQYAHSIGIFHGMLSPSKILLSASGIVKIDDFQFLDLKNTYMKQVQTRIKRKQQMYLAPEQLLGKEADHRCDLFSAGVIAYRMLTGKHPFLEERSEWTTMQITACNPKLIFELDPTIPSAVEDLVEKMMEKELNRRAQSAEEAIACLDSYLDRFGDVRPYDVLASFLKKPLQSVEQLNLLRAEEYLQQAAQFQLQEQWDAALISCYRAHFLKPRDRAVEQEIKTLCERAGYVSPSGKDPKFVQLEQSLHANPDNVQILQRLASLSRSRGELLRCLLYYKKILKASPSDPFARAQIKQLLQERNPNDPLLPPVDPKWTRWQDLARGQKRPFWQRPTALQGNLALTGMVLMLAILIGAIHFLRLAPPPASPTLATARVTVTGSPAVLNQKLNTVCEQASALYRVGDINKAIEILSKAPMTEKGSAAARARLMLADYWLELQSPDHAMPVLNAIDIGSADPEQKVRIFETKAEVYRLQGLYGHAIDQYINIKALPGLPRSSREAADARIEALQQEAGKSDDSATPAAPTN